MIGWIGHMNQIEVGYSKYWIGYIYSCDYLANNQYHYLSRGLGGEGEISL